MNEDLKIALIVVFILVIIDIFSGFAAAWATKNLQSSKLREGLWHKVGYVFVIFAALVVEWASLHGLKLGFEIPLAIPICIWISLMEVVSTLENARKINPDLASVPGFGMLKKDDKEEEK